LFHLECKLETNKSFKVRFFVSDFTTFIRTERERERERIMCDF